jgi:hypothetical protein
MSANILVYSNLILSIILLKYAGRSISMEEQFAPYTLKTVDAVSGLVATVAIPSEGR